jgi:polysaccharide export outer membrane protein
MHVSRISPLNTLPNIFGSVRGSGGVALLLLAGCMSVELPPRAMVPAPPMASFSASEALRQFDESPEPFYRIGEGDIINLQVWDRVDLSGPQTVGPDGMITLPVAGSLKIAGMTREEAAAATKAALAKLYKEVTVTIRVDSYVANHVFVLGRVRNPGAIQFLGPPTLLEALSRAGGVVQDGNSTAVSHCAIIRGRDRLAWIDLRRLLENADLTLNLRLKANDILLVPDWEDVPIYVLGQVTRPGLQRWIPGMTFMDAISRAGGFTLDASTSSIIVVRPSEDLRFTVSLDQLLWPDPLQNISIHKGDIVYVPMSAMGEFGYIMSRLNPFSWVFLATTIK